MTHPYFDGRTPRVLAHRGLTLSDHAHAENSLAAVAAALSAGVEYVESDCHVTRDGEVVLFHDDSVDRVTGDPRLVADLTARELADLMLDRGGLLTLAEALDGFPDARWNLDVKAEAAAGPVGRLVAPHAQRVLLTSFSEQRRQAALDACLRAGAELRPATSPGTAVVARLAAAVAAGSKRLAARILADVDAVQIPERHRGIPVLTDRLIRFVHAADREVHIWTVNDVGRMRALVGRGVDGIVTDRADLALDALA